MRFTTRQTANGALVVVASWHSPCVLDVAEQVHRGLPLVKSAAGHTWCSVREMAGQSAGSGPAGAEQSSAIFRTLAESAVRPNLACVRILLPFGGGRDLGAELDSVDDIAQTDVGKACATHTRREPTKKSSAAKYRAWQGAQARPLP